MTQQSPSVLVAMSGGVDSSVAAALLLEQRCSVTGVYLCLKAPGQADDAVGRCCSPADAADARAVAEMLGIKLISMPVMGAFDPIIAEFVSEYANGRTPNPCIRCNATIKFGKLIELADSLGIDHVATGHYARMIDVPGGRAIARGCDAKKDQSYALFAVGRQYLGRMILPIGELADKQATRAKARALSLPVHDKPDSQEICFVPDDNYTELLTRRAPQALRPGPIVDSAGNVLGQHNGYAQYTIGQRRGLGVAAGEPRYVTAIDPATATVTIGPKSEVMRRELTAHQTNWHADVADAFDATVQIRYNHRGAPAHVQLSGPESFSAAFTEAVSAITPGQAAVVYEDDRLLGGGWID